MPKISAKEQKEITVDARKALHPLWIKAFLRGRCWGVKQEDKNPFQGTNITMGTENEIVTVSQADGILKIHEFKRTTGTSLGNATKELLRRKNLKFKEGQDEKI